jgi:hypothetical protein
VHVLDNGGPQAVEVRLGLNDGSRTEILGDALAEGTEVIVGAAAPRGAAHGGFPRGRFF